MIISVSHSIKYVSVLLFAMLGYCAIAQRSDCDGYVDKIDGTFTKMEGKQKIYWDFNGSYFIPIPKVGNTAKKVPIEAPDAISFTLPLALDMRRIAYLIFLKILYLFLAIAFMFVFPVHLLP